MYNSNYLLHNLASALGLDQQGILHNTVTLPVQTTVGITDSGCAIKIDWWPYGTICSAI